MDRYGHLMDGLDDQIATEHAEHVIDRAPDHAETPGWRGFLPTDSLQASPRSPDRI
jgi:hypothetical protein